MTHVGQAEAAEALETILLRQKFVPEAETFLRTLIGGTLQHQVALDNQISQNLRDWQLERLAVTDLIALRLAAFEIYNLPGMPPKVSVSQAVILAKSYGSEESGRFVNGVLGSLLKQSPKANWDPSQEDRPEWDDPYEASPAPDDESDQTDEEQVISEGSQEYEDVLRAGPWVIRRPE
jgi:N utilization substance protein B